jgi:hypothetical protein
MADESIIADLKSQGFDKLIQDLSLSAKGFTELDKSMAEAQKKLDTLDKSSQEFKDLTKEINAAAIASKAYAESNDTLKKELRDTTNEIGNLERSIKALEKAGQTNTQTYKDLTSQQDTLRKKAGELKDTIGDLNAEIKNSGSDTRNLDKAVRAISTVASGYQVAQGALALYGGENKKFEQTLLKLNAVMAITQGLQQIQEELSKRDSVFTQAAAKAKLLYAAAIGTSTGAMKAFKVALLSTGIGVLIVGVTTLIANFDDLTKSGGFLSKALNGIGDVVSKSIQAYKDLSDAIGLTNFAAKKAAEDEKIRQDEALDDLLRAQKVKIAILKIQGKETAEFELQLLKDEKVRNRQKLLEYDGLTDDERKKVLERQKVLSDEIEIQEAVIKQISIDASKSAAEELLKQKKKEQNDRLKALSDAIENTFKIRKAEREAEARHQAQLDELDRKERERLQSTADFRKLKSAEYIAELEAQDQREKAIREKSDDERKVKEEAFRTARAERENADRERRLQAEQEHIEKIGNLIGGLTDVANRIGNLASQAIEVRSQNEIRALDQRKQQGLISEKQYQKEMAKIKNEAARKQRTADIAMAFAMIPQAAFSAFTSTPGGIVVKSIAAALASAFGLAQVALIASAPLPQFRDGGQVSKKLGLIKGARHERGGVPIEVEGEEYVMPVEQTKENLPALEAMRKGKFNELFIPKQNVMQPDVFANIPNPSNIALPIVNENNDYSSINKRLDKLASEMWWLGQYTKEGNKVRERGTEKIVKNLETQRKRYV